MFLFKRNIVKFLIKKLLVSLLLVTGSMMTLQSMNQELVECPVCMDTFKSTQLMSNLFNDCSHRWDARCALELLKMDIIRCPLCRAEQNKEKVKKFKDAFYKAYFDLPKAIKEKNIIEVIKLLRSGFIYDINAYQMNKHTYLCMAIRSGYKKIVGELVKSGADVEGKCKNSKCNFPLQEALGEGRLDIVTVMLWESLYFAMMHDDEEKFVKLLSLLQDYEIDINITNNYGWTLLGYASRHGKKRFVELLLEVPGIDPWANSYGRYRNRFRHTPLAWARYYNHREVVELLEQHIKKLKRMGRGYGH